MTATIAANGFIEIPEAFRQEDAIREGEKFEIERLGRKEYRLRPSVPATRANQGLVDRLLACPVKDFFVPMERGQTTDDLKHIDFG